MTFHAPEADIWFTLAHVSGAADLPEWEGDLAAGVLGHFARLAEQVLAPLDAPGDAQGCRMVAGRVHMPDGYGAAFGDLAAQGWMGLSAPQAYGGQGLGAVIQGAVTEVFAGANHALQMVTGLVPGAIATLQAHGTAEQQAHWLPMLAQGHALSTMCLTEAAAGSDLAAIRTRAVQGPDGWQVTGQKIFISGGDQNLTPEILHLVLARSGGPGVRGLSLFLVPSHLSGRPNRVRVTRIEEKLGLHASPTCQMEFEGAAAELIGAEGQGLAAMFTMMDHARIDVALQGVAHAARAADSTTRYAAARMQGRDADGRAVAIAAHDDVAAMLAEMDFLALGGRAMCHGALVALERGQHQLAAALTPVCKWFCTTAGIRAADLAIQTMGGYGYLRDYGAEQNWRDARICAIYEGTNGIHARSLATRLIRHQDGAALDALEKWAGAPEPFAKGWAQARVAMAAHPHPERAATAFMALTAEMLFQSMWQRIGAQGTLHPDPARISRLAQQVAQRGRILLPSLCAAVAEDLA